jgi:uncharacterized DUF497 family protein
VAIVFDPNKSKENLRRRGLPFDLARDFDWSSAVVVEDLRKLYPERRFQALGIIAGHLHMLVYTPVAGGIRVISLRRASRKERRIYGRED